MANTQNEAITFSSVAAGTNLHFVCDTVMDLDANSNATNIGQIGTPYDFSWSGTGASGGKNYNVDVSGQWNGYYFGALTADTVDLWTATGTVTVASSDTVPPTSKTFSFSKSGGSKTNLTPRYMTNYNAPSPMWTYYSSSDGMGGSTSDLWTALANPAVPFVNLSYGDMHIIYINSTTAQLIKAIEIEYQFTPSSAGAYCIAGSTNYNPNDSYSRPNKTNYSTFFSDNADVQVYAATSYYDNYAPAGFTLMPVDGNTHSLLLVVNQSIKYLWIYGGFSSGTNKINSLRIYV